MLLFYKYKYKIPEPQRRKHTLILGSTWSGKSELMKTLIHQHILKGKTAIVLFDPNGDFSEQVAMFKENARPEKRRKVIYINPSEFENEFPVINPLDLPNVSAETLDKVTQALHQTLLQSFKEMDIKLSWAMDGMLYNMIHTLYRKKGSTLLDLVRFVDDTNNSDLVKLGTQTDNYVIKDYFAYKFMQPNNNVIKSWLASRINIFLAAQTLQRLIVGKTTIDLKKEINKRSLIIFNLSKWKLGSKVAKIYGRFLMTTVLNLTLARADVPEENRVPCHFYFDEFQNYLSDSLIEVFAEGRKYRSYLTVATQVIGVGMSSDMKKSILWNCNVKIIWKAGYESREEMIKQMDYVENYTMKKRGIWKRTFSKLMVGRFIMQYGISNPRKLKVPKFLLWNKHNMSDKNRKMILDDLKENKYAKPFYVKTKVKSTNTQQYNYNSDSTLTIEKFEHQIPPKRKFRSNLES